MKKRLLAAILTLVLVASFAPTSALAVEGDVAEPCTQTEGCTLADGHEGECVTTPDEPEDGIMLTAAEDVTVTVSAGQTLKEAFDATYGNNEYSSVTKIKVITNDSVVLTGDDFYFLSAVKRTADSTKAGGFTSQYSPNATYALINLTEVDLSEAAIENNALPVHAFRANTKITKIVVPDNLIEIGRHACSKMTALAYWGTKEGNLKFPSGLTKIFNGAFYEDAALSGELALPKCLQIIDGSAFYKTGIDGTLTVPGTVGVSSDSEQRQFYGTKITSLIFEKGINKIPNEFARDCTKLTSVTLPESVRIIGESAFLGTTDLKSIGLNEGLEEIQKTAFYTYTTGTANNFFGGLEGTIFIPASVKTIGVNAFGFTNLENVVLLGDPESVGKWVFSNLKPDSLHTIYLNEEHNRNDWKNENTDDSTWTRTKTILAYLNGGVVPAETNFESGKLASPVKDGYTFSGWYSDSSLSGETVTNPAARQTYYAKWTLAAPTSVTVSADKTTIAKNTGSATLTATTAPELAEDSKITYQYQWYTGTPNNGTEINGATSQTYTAQNLTTATSYYCTVKASCGEEVSTAVTSSTVTINVAENEGSVTISNSTTTATYGDEPFTFTYTSSGTATVESSDTSIATVQDNSGTVTVTIVGAGSTTISVSSEASEDYTAASAEFALTVNKATLTITAEDESIYVGGALPTAYSYTVTGWQGSDENTVTLEGVSAACADANANKAGSYTITVTGPESIDNYTIAYVNGTLTVRNRSTGGGGGNVSGNTTTETVTNKDGSKTTIVTDKKTGTVTETTKFKDGSTLVVETKKDGTVTTTETAANGVKVKTVDEPREDVTATVTIPRSVGTATVTVPAEVTPGTVAVNAKTGEIVKLSVPTEDGLTVKLDGSAELVLVDNSKDFTDTADHWAEDAIDFATAHEMFSGTSADTFSPEDAMTRAMLMTVLARFDGQDTNGGAVWYEKGMEWAKANGVSDGTNPNGNITREQFATMLYRYAGSPAVDGGIGHFSDAGKVSGYATDAVRWAVSTGIIGGMGDGTIAPQGNATRAQVATMLMRFCANLTK